ncbi:hypothetical protein [Flavobacterium terrisoli]|uniref:hypothetical protein n=1 Tax=Flavobacterium terrisoli TaxID=3242195 RepID=UPI00254336EC|nr:hypothetical protein [Flavobacterium buctense]
MKNTSFFDHVKCVVRNECNNIEDQKSEIQNEELKTENAKQESKLNFQLFDIDQVFAN